MLELNFAAIQRTHPQFSDDFMDLFKQEVNVSGTFAKAVAKSIFKGS